MNKIFASALLLIGAAVSSARHQVASLNPSGYFFGQNGYVDLWGSLTFDAGYSTVFDS